MSGATGSPSTSFDFRALTPASVRNSLIEEIEDQGRALKFCEQPGTPRALAQAIDSVSGIEGAGIVCRVRTSTGASRIKSLRLPRAPGDIRVCILFGLPSPTPGATFTNVHLRNELLAGGLSCGAAVLGWIGFVAGAALAVPTGGLAVAGMIYDGLAGSAASIACVNSAMRVLNEAHGHHEINEKLDGNSAYSRTMLGMDVFGAAGIYRGGADGVRAIRALGTGASAARGAAAAVRVIALDREMKVRLLNAVGAAISLASSNDTGALGEMEKGLGIPFSIVLSN